ncbi:hypothetical protein KAU33_01665 [Candidatus Dependentiae bacterium]|nr:hypothetical protein [Candidatus Dependentiae bacterium]
MKKRYVLRRLFFLIVSVLIFSLFINGCTSSNHFFKQKKELKYPEWPGLDEYIEHCERYIDDHNKQFPDDQITNFHRIGVKPEYIKWHLELYFFNVSHFDDLYISKIMKIINTGDCEIYKKYGSLVVYIKLNNAEDLRNHFFKSLEL